MDLLIPKQSGVPAGGSFGERSLPEIVSQSAKRYVQRAAQRPGHEGTVTASRAVYRLRN